MDQKTVIPGMPTVIPPGLTREQERAYIGNGPAPRPFPPRPRYRRAEQGEGPRGLGRGKGYNVINNLESKVKMVFLSQKHHFMR
uniref:Uncharacterized protein n=1 Tax=Amazona collaria TaxID=241587 RepID=A0A8B9GBK1_9PSIT